MFVRHQAGFKSALLFTVKEVLRKLSTYSNMVTELAYANGTKCPKLEPGTLRLYSMRFCPYAQRTRMVLEYKQIPHEIVNINLKFKPDWFLEKNPIGLVPVIEHDSKIIYESLICNDYLEKIFPDPPLNPTDPYLKAKDQMLVSHMDKMTKLFRKAISKHKDKKNDVLKSQLTSKLCYFEEELKQRGGPFFGGKQVSMADINLWPWFEKIDGIRMLTEIYDHLIISKYPLLFQWNETMLLQPAAKATQIESQYQIAFLNSFGDGNPDYDFGLQLNKSKL